MSVFSLFSKNWLVWRIGRRHLESVAHLAAGRALDIGCGQMPMRPVFQGRVASIVGLDLQAPRGAGWPVSVRGDALRLPLRDGSFDTAICLQVLEHVPEPEICLREAFRVLKPGGVLILTAPHIWNVHPSPGDYYRFTQQGLEYLMKKAGFEEVEVTPMAGYFVTTAARFCYFLAHFDRWGGQMIVRPLYLVVQAVGWLLDRVYCDRTETWNYVAVGRRGGSQG